MAPVSSGRDLQDPADEPLAGNARARSRNVCLGSLDASGSGETQNRHRALAATAGAATAQPVSDRHDAREITRCVDAGLGLDGESDPGRRNRYRVDVPAALPVQSMSQPRSKDKVYKWGTDSRWIRVTFRDDKVSAGTFKTEQGLK